MADVKIRVKSEFDGKGFDQAEKSTNRLKKSTAALGSTLQGLGTALIAAGAFEFAKESVNLAREQAAAEAQVAAAIESTGMAAGLTLDELKAHASALQNVTNFGDEATLSAQALLLTFTNIRRDVFPQATTTVLDMSAALGQDLKSSAIQLGKALNDPTQGVTALQRVGVSFTQQQRDLIKTLDESGRTLEAQNLILAELNRQFGGSAEAAREADGGFIAMSNSFGDLQESLGELVLEMNSAVDATGALDSAIQKLTAGAVAWRESFDNVREIGRLIGQRVAPEIAENVIKIAEFFGGEEAVAGVRQWAKEHVESIEAVEQAQDDFIQDQNDEFLPEEEEVNEDYINLQKDLARDLIDIQEDTTERLADLAQDRREALEDAEEDSQDRINDIVESGAKDRIKIEKDLARDLARSKQREDKQIADLIKRNEKEEKRQRRLQQIDTKADERLFQFELRQLAAEGEAIAIRDALERRAIEEEIAREKAEVEKEIEAEKQDDQIAAIREEGQARRQELQLDAQERKQLLEEREREEIAAERESLAERKQDLMEFYEERREQVREAEEEALEALGHQLAEMEDLTTEQFQELVGIAKDFGQEFGAQFAEGLGQGFAENTAVGELLGIGVGAPSPFAENPIPGDPASHFQTGGVVQGQPGQPQLAVLHGGEEVANPNIGQSITIGGETFAVREASKMANAIRSHTNMMIQAFADELADTLSI